MEHNVSDPWRRQAQALLARLAVQCSPDRGKGVGSMSSSLYDTAWLSMVQKPTHSGLRTGEPDIWLFPECFEFVLSQQLASGAWKSYATPVDGILNTAAALLSLTKHLQSRPGNHDWEVRSQKAKAALETILGKWDMHSTDQVGQEILIISLLDLLRENGACIEFPQLSSLQAVRAAKLSKIQPQTVYKYRSTLYHSLEAFIGHIDFNYVAQWREENGSMMNSPAATAAYLIHSSTWDENAELYLRDVINRDGGPHDGSVPCAWPTTIFEISWVISTLAVVSVSPNPPDALIFTDLLKDTLTQQKGLLGFAPGVLPDVDDTAMGLKALQYLGGTTNIEAVIETFEGNGSFLTYAGELNPSFSANCNVLSLLLSRHDSIDFIPQITKIVTFLANKAFNGNIKDKWHCHELYWTMLLARASELFYQREEIVQIVYKSNPNLQGQVPMILLQLLLRILHTQQSNGSWEGICEITSYAVLALSSMVKLPFVRQLDKGQVISKMALGKSFLYANQDKWAKGEHIWIEKVTYSSDILSEAYCLAASLVPVPFMIEPEPAAAISPSLAAKEFLVPEKLLIGMRKAGSLIARTPLFRTTQPSTLRIAEMQACFAMQALQQRPLDIFPRTAKGKDKYTFIVPLALTLCAESQGCSTSLFVLYEMMVLSILNFRADEYVEGALEKDFATDLDSIRRLVEQLFVDFQPKVQNVTATNGNGVSRKQHYQSPGSFNNDLRAGVENGDQHNGFEHAISMEDVKDVLSRFLRQILEHPAVQLCPARLQSRLAFDLKTFLLSHITQAEDNVRLRAASKLNGGSTPQNKSDTCNRPGRSFYRWIRDVSADHTSCPYSFVFLECLVHATLSNPNHSTYQMRTNPDALAGARAAYLAEDTCRHLASLCRMYNDYGSLARDAEEQTLNSLDFPEFSRGIETSIPEQDTAMPFSSSSLSAPEKAKAELLWIAEYERRGLETAMKLLAEELGPGELIDALRMLVDVTDLYGQIYTVKDIGTRTR